MAEKDEKQYFIAKVLGDPSRYLVKLGTHQFNYGQQVIVKTQHGEFLAYINSFLFTQIPEEFKALETVRLLRYADQSDIELSNELEIKSTPLKKRVSTLVQELNLDMNVTHLILDLKEENLFIYYTASERVDFRELLRRLRQEWRYKSTLRHITPKQRQHAFIVDPRIPKN